MAKGKKKTNFISVDLDKINIDTKETRRASVKNSDNFSS